MTKRYITFNFDVEPPMVIEYERLGDCNSCGECCLSELEYRHAPCGDNCQGIGHSIPESPAGLWHGVFDDGVYYLHRVKKIEHSGKGCVELSKGVCQIHHKKSYKDGLQPICAIWPTNPIEVACFPECGYSFNEIARWEYQEKDSGGESLAEQPALDLREKV